MTYCKYFSCIDFVLFCISFMNHISGRIHIKHCLLYIGTIYCRFMQRANSVKCLCECYFAMPCVYNKVIVKGIVGQALLLHQILIIIIGVG